MDIGACAGSCRGGERPGRRVAALPVIVHGPAFRPARLGGRRRRLICRSGQGGPPRGGLPVVGDRLVAQVGAYGAGGFGGRRPERAVRAPVLVAAQPFAEQLPDVLELGFGKSAERLDHLLCPGRIAGLVTVLRLRVSSGHVLSIRGCPGLMCRQPSIYIYYHLSLTESCPLRAGSAGPMASDVSGGSLVRAVLLAPVTGSPGRAAGVRPAGRSGGRSDPPGPRWSRPARPGPPARSW